MGQNIIIDGFSFQAFFTKDFEREHPTEVHFLDVMKSLLHEQVIQKLQKSEIGISGMHTPRKHSLHTQPKHKMSMSLLNDQFQNRHHN
jgi:hypothetical protein